MSYLRLGNSLRKSFQNVTAAHSRSAYITADGRGPCNEHFNSCYKVNYTNSQCDIPPEKLDNTTLLKYKFPTISLNYSPEDCVQHALSVGIDHGYSNAKRLLNKDSNLEVLPSFLLPFENHILVDLVNCVVLPGRSVHAEQFIHLYQPLKPEDEIMFNLEVVDIIDKAKGTLYIINFHGSDEMGNEIFLLETQVYEIGTKGVGRKDARYKSEKIMRPPNRTPEQLFRFKTVKVSAEKLNPPSTAKFESIFSVEHPTQHYAVTGIFTSKVHCHGYYYLGAVMQQILGYYANGNTKLIRRVKTRFSNPVYPGNTLVTKSWKIENRIHFETFVNESGKCALEGSYLDLME